MEQPHKKSITTEALLEAASTLFIERGYSAVSTRDIAEKAQVNLGAIQYHFGCKSHLFIETIRRLMHQHFADSAITELIGHSPVSQHEAGLLLYSFVEAFMHDILRPSGPQVWRLMYREVLGENSLDPKMFDVLVGSVVNEFMAPVDSWVRTLMKMLDPDLHGRQLEYAMQSIFGQCSFYFTHRPFVERIRGRKLEEPENLPALVAHIMGFSLRGLGLTEDTADAIIRNAEQLRREAANRPEVDNHQK